MPGTINGTRVIALVGPAGAGKTSLAEAMLFATGAIDRQGIDGNGIDHRRLQPRSAGARRIDRNQHHAFRLSRASISPCSTAPGRSALPPTARARVAVADLAIVVVDPDPARAALAAPALRMLDELGVPHIIFVNRIDQARGRIRDLMSALQPMSVSPLIARQIPIRDGDKVTGFVDLALERAFAYRPGSGVGAHRNSRRARWSSETKARTQMLEQLADHDDTLARAIADGRNARAGDDLRRPGQRNPRQSRRVGAVRLGRRRLGRAAAAEGAAP